MHQQDTERRPPRRLMLAAAADVAAPAPSPLPFCHATLRFDAYAEDFRYLLPLNI